MSMAWVEEEEVWYKIFISEEMVTPHKAEIKLTIVRSTWLKEIQDDKQKNRYILNSDGDYVKFKTKNEAKKWLNKYVRPMYIDPEYLEVNPEDHFTGVIFQSIFFK
jgi:hypothetical protein